MNKPINGAKLKAWERRDFSSNFKQSQIVIWLICNKIIQCAIFHHQILKFEGLHKSHVNLGLFTVFPEELETPTHTVREHTLMHLIMMVIDPTGSIHTNTTGGMLINGLKRVASR